MLLTRTPGLGRAAIVSLFLMFAVILVSIPALGQSDNNPKWDLFAGYQWLHPGGSVPTPLGDPFNPTPLKIQDMSAGFGSALTYNFNHHWGIEFDFGHNWGNDNYQTTASVGPRFIWRTDEANYFLHTLVSYNRLSVSLLPKSNVPGAILGGGMDLPIRKWFALRLFEADYVWSHQNYANLVFTDSGLRRPYFDGVRLRTGLVFNFGGAPEVAPTAACSVQPTEVMVGEPITANVTASNFNPKHTVTYAWSGTGGKVTGKDTTASIDTTDVAPGSYTVTAHVTDPKTKKNNEASCSANYTVKPLPPKNPPTMSCSANPSSVVTGGSATVTCNCTSPDGVPVSVANWTSTGGTISGSGSSATLSTAGASAGPVTVGASCTDSRGLAGQASTQVTVENPPPPPVDKALEARLALHSVYFPTAQPPIKDPNAGLLASQQQTLTTLAADFQTYIKSKPDAHLILEGHADPRGSAAYNQALSERRVARVKSFLIEHGVAESAIETKAHGSQSNLTDAEVRESVNNDATITKEERARIMRNERTIILASNRRVDVTLSTTGEVSKRQFPFSAADSLSLIGGRQAAKKPAPTASKKPAAKKKK